MGNKKNRELKRKAKIYGSATVTINGKSATSVSNIEYSTTSEGGRVEEKSKTQDVEWDDIAGLDDAKTALRAAIEHPIIHADLFKRYGKRSPKGVLLYGPPGCGKTLIGKAAATSMRRLYANKPKPAPVVVNSNSLGMYSFSFSLNPWERTTSPKPKHEGGFFYIKAPEILNCYVGESEKRVRQIFEDARLFKKEHGYPAVVFIDEAEAILCHRSKGGSNGVMAGTIVPQFLSEMDGFDDPGCFLLLATNRPDDLDPAVVRPGRIDRRIHITRPDQAQAIAAFRIHLRSKFSAVDPVWCAQELYATQRVLYQLTGDSQRSRIVTLGDLMSGAEIAGLVERACDSAIARDIEAGGEPTGINQDDIQAAIDDVEIEHRSANHFDDLFLISKAMGEQAVTVRKTAKDGSLFEVVTAKGHATESKALN